MEFKKHPMFIVYTGIIIGIGRYLMRYINDKNIYDYVNLIFMAIVNYVAIGLIFLFIHSNAQIKFENRINKSGMATLEKKKRLSTFNTLSTVVIGLYLLLGIIYVVKFKTPDLNDVISIIALSMSICTTDLSDLAYEKYWKICSKKKKNKEQD